jgi:hypothetical protein
MRKLVVYLDVNRSNHVFDTRVFYMNVDMVPHLVLIIAVEFATEKSKDVVGFYGVDRS